MTARVGWLSCCAERHLEAGSLGSRAGGDETQGGSFGRRNKVDLRSCSFLPSWTLAASPD